MLTGSRLAATTFVRDAKQAAHDRECNALKTC